MNLLFPRQQYACLQCGKSCGDWRIWVEPPAVESLRRHPLSLELKVRGETFLQAAADGWHHLVHDSQGRCHFLQEDLLCGLHATSGWMAKPRACRQFPFFLIQTPDSIQVGLSFRCTAVLQDHGRDWSDHQSDLQQLVESGSYPKVGFQPAQLGNFTLDWTTYKNWEADWIATIERGDSLAQAVYADLAPALGLFLDGPTWGQLLQQLGRTAVAFLEGEGAEDLQQIRLALQSGQGFSGKQRGWLEPHLQPLQPDPLLQRYLIHALERKSLWLGDWLGRLLMLLVAQYLAEFYAPPLGWEKAVELVEGEWLAHRDDLAEVEQGFAQTLLQFT